MTNYRHHASLAKQKRPISTFLSIAWLRGVPSTYRAWPDRYANQTNVCSCTRRAWLRPDAGNQTPRYWLTGMKGRGDFTVYVCPPPPCQGSASVQLGGPYRPVGSRPIKFLSPRRSAQRVNDAAHNACKPCSSTCAIN
jgi:hypothetical protein